MLRPNQLFLDQPSYYWTVRRTLFPFSTSDTGCMLAQFVVQDTFIEILLTQQSSPVFPPQYPRIAFRKKSALTTIP